MEQIKVDLFQGLIDKEVSIIENEMALITEMSRTLLKRKEYDRYIKTAEKLVRMSKDVDYLLEFKKEVIDLVNHSRLKQPPKSPNIDEGYVNKEANYMEGLIKAVTDLAEENPPEAPKKKVDGGNSELKKALERYGDRPLNPISGLDIGEDGVISDSNW